jgi:hypothetical protein
VVINVLVATFLVAHAAIHLAFIAPSPPVTADGPAWPFTTNDSWLLERLGLDPAGTRVLAGALVAAALIALAIASLAALGVVAVGLWVPALTVGAAASLGLLIAFFHPWLGLGIAIDVGLLWAGLLAGWVPASSGVAGS